MRNIPGFLLDVSVTPSSLTSYHLSTFCLQARKLERVDWARCDWLTDTTNQPQLRRSVHVYLNRCIYLLYQWIHVYNTILIIQNWIEKRTASINTLWSYEVVLEVWFFIKEMEAMSMQTHFLGTPPIAVWKTCPEKPQKLGEINSSEHPAVT